MALPWQRLLGASARAPDETKSISSQALFAMLGTSSSWSGRGFASLVNQGYARNPVVFRCIRLIAEAATRIPFAVHEGGQPLHEHPVQQLLACPNPRQSGADLFEALYVYLYTSGNAYLEAVLTPEGVKGLYALRPDRMRVAPGEDGWPVAYEYTTSRRSVRLSQLTRPVPRVLQLKLFHPLDDHYGLSPLQAAQCALDTHNAAVHWNKSLLDNAARPSGALVYSGRHGNLSKPQFERLKEELEVGFQGASNAGRPMVLEGELDWKSMALSPRDMDFIEAKNSAARDIALAFGVPPMLLGLPGDNTYANFAEANRVFWRHTVVPLVNRVARSLAGWLQPAYEAPLELVPQLEGIEALGEDRTALWQRVGNADFLDDEEKRALLGLPPRKGGAAKPYPGGGNGNG